MGMRLAVVALAAMLALASPAGAARAPSAEGTLLACAHHARAARGLEPLKVDRALHSVAHRFAADMARRGFFDHVDPDGHDPGDRIEAKGRYVTWARTSPGATRTLPRPAAAGCAARATDATSSTATSPASGPVSRRGATAASSSRTSAPRPRIRRDDRRHRSDRRARRARRPPS